MSIELEAPGNVEPAALQSLARSVRAGWRIDRLDPALWDRAPAETIASTSARIVAREAGDLVGAVAVTADPEYSRLFGRETWRVSALVARDEAIETALLIAASKSVADRDLLHWRSFEAGEMPSAWAPDFSVIDHGALFGRRVERHVEPLDARALPGNDDREALLAIAREAAEQPPGTSDEASLERSREVTAGIVADALSRSRSLVVSREGERVTGVAVLAGSPPIGCIRFLAVARSQHRRGHGARLVAAAGTLARQDGWEWLLVAASRENHAAIRLYASTGFRELGEYVLLRRPGTTMATPASMGC